MSVERASRLRRYLRKDYSQIVEFPVEIVGRDGHVRRYSYDDSVRLYHRRIHSAAMRYDDPQLIDAEVRHCRQRIDQLRRSYLEHYGWGPLRAGQARGLFAGPLAAEVAAFVRRVFSHSTGPMALTLTPMESGSFETCFLQCADTGRAYMLYVWRIDTHGPAGAKDEFRAAWRRLAAAPVAEGVERLFVAHEGPDIALILAGDGDWDGPSFPPPGEDGFGAGFEDVDPWHGGLRALYEGNVSEALRQFEAGIETQPARPVLVQATALVALLDDQPERAEFAARQGCLQFPADPLLACLLAQALARRGALDDARRAVASVGERGARHGGVRLVDAMLHLASGRMVEAWRGLDAIRDPPSEEPRFEARVGRAIRRVMAQHAAAAVAGTLLLVAGAGVLVFGDPSLGLLLSAVGPVLGLSSTGLLRVRARAALAGRRGRIPRLVSLEMLPRERPNDGQ